MLSLNDIKPGFVGAGRMATALGRGISTGNGDATGVVHFFDPSDAAATRFQEACHGADRKGSLKELAAQCRLLILAVKPQVLPAMLADLAPWTCDSHLVLSVVAGATLQTLGDRLKTSRIVRAMPNTPCLIGQGITALAFSEAVEAADREIAQELFGSVGQTIEVPEYQLDAVTGLSGSGPAWVFTFVEALVEGGVLAGLPREAATRLVLQTIRGSVGLLDETGASPASLREEVTSPGGTTIAGLVVLERSGFRAAVMDAVQAAARRATELGR